MEKPEATIKVHSEILKILGERKDLEDFVNNIVFVYLSGGFIRKSDLAGTVVVKNMYRRASMSGPRMFDTVTQEFKGVVLSNQSASQSFFISNDKLVDLLEEHQVVLVLKSPRKKGISTVKEKTSSDPSLPSEELT